MQRVLSEVRVVLHDLQALSRVALVLRRGVVVFAIFGAHHTNNLSGFGFLCHFGPLLADEGIVPPRQPSDYALALSSISRAGPNRRVPGPAP